MKKLALSSDHGGFEQKEKLKVYLSDQGYQVVDYGVQSLESQDYPDFIYPAAHAVRDHEVDLGIIICGTGIGASIVANKVKGVRAALVNQPEVAVLTRQHNNSNVLALAGRTTDYETNLKVVDAWLNTEFSGDARHQRRIDKISEIEIKEGRK